MPMLSRLLLAAALALPCLAAYGQEAEPPIEANPMFECVSVLNAMGHLRKAQKIPGVEVDQIEGEEADRFMKQFNEAEPPTNYEADIILFVMAPNGVGMVTIVKNDRACLLKKPIPVPAIKGLLMFLRKKDGVDA